MKYNYKYYDQISKSYNFTRKFFLFGYKSLLRYIINQKNITSILDLASGTGKFLADLHKVKPNLKLSGVDLSSNMLQIAKKNYPDIKFINEDVFELTHIDDDLIILNYFLTLFDDPELLLSHLNKIISKKSRIIILDFYSFDNPIYAYFMKYQGAKCTLDIINIIEKYFEIEIIKTKKSPYLLWKYGILSLKKINI